MTNKRSTSLVNDKANSTPFPDLGEAGTALQMELLDAYQEISRIWLNRVQSEVTLWSEIATKLAATRSVPEALQAYSKCTAQRIHETASNGQALFDDCQQVMQKVCNSLATGWVTGDYAPIHKKMKFGKGSAQLEN